MDDISIFRAVHTPEDGYIQVVVAIIEQAKTDFFRYYKIYKKAHAEYAIRGMEEIYRFYCSKAGELYMLGRNDEAWAALVSEAEKNFGGIDFPLPKFGNKFPDYLKLKH